MFLKILLPLLKFFNVSILFIDMYIPYISTGCSQILKNKLPSKLIYIYSKLKEEESVKCAIHTKIYKYIIIWIKQPVIKI